MSKYLVYPGKCSMCIWEECIYCACSVKVSEFAMKSWCFILLLKHSVSLLRLPFSCSIHFESGILKSPNIVIELSPSSILSVLLQVHVGSVFRCIHVYVCYTFLMNFLYITKNHSSSLEALFALMSLFSDVQFLCGYSVQVVSDCTVESTVCLLHGISLMVQWLRLHAPNEKGPDLMLVRKLDPICCN